MPGVTWIKHACAASIFREYTVHRTGLSPSYMNGKKVKINNF